MVEKIRNYQVHYLNHNSPLIFEIAVTSLFGEWDTYIHFMLLNEH